MDVSIQRRQGATSLPPIPTVTATATNFNTDFHTQSKIEHQQFVIPYQGNPNLSAFDDASTVIRDDTWSCDIVLLSFCFFGLSLSFSSTLFVI